MNYIYLSFNFYKKNNSNDIILIFHFIKKNKIHFKGLIKNFCEIKKHKMIKILSLIIIIKFNSI